MKWLVALLGVAILSISVNAAVSEGENLLVNGSFDAEQVAFPEFWNPSSTTNVRESATIPNATGCSSIL